VSTIAERLEMIDRRLAEHAGNLPGGGLTQPDADTQERWEAAQVWAHMAEFVAYWLDQAQGVVARFQDEPVDFGRVKTDPGRIAAIESGRHAPIGELAAATRAGLEANRRFLDRLAPEQLHARGRHQTLGEMDVEGLIDRFVVAHMEEHLAQLDGLQRDETA